MGGLSGTGSCLLIGGVGFLHVPDCGWGVGWGWVPGWLFTGIGYLLAWVGTDLEVGTDLKMGTGLDMGAGYNLWAVFLVVAIIQIPYCGWGAECG